VNVLYRHRMAGRYGMVDPKRRAVKHAGVLTFVKVAGFGAASGVGMLVLAATEQSFAHLVNRSLETQVSKYDIASPIIGHAVALAIFGAAGTVAFSYVKKRVEKHGDIVEPAYLAPPTSPYVTAGPRSGIRFDQIGMEGRRFVLMTLTPEVISAVMGEPAIDPVRVVAGYEAGHNTEERAAACLQEMEAVGAFDRSLICIAAPTGVGYVSYTFAEALEYLTLGDCAIVVPQYALVPSALAIFDTHDGVNLQKMVIEMAHQRIKQMPAEQRPRLVQFGESLGAQVALDIAYPHGSVDFDAMGIDAGLYFGVPFRSATWNAWRRARSQFDPLQSIVLISEPDEFEQLSQTARRRMRHLMVVHDDDPVNKFAYSLIIRPPWWMGPPKTRPPKVPRETTWVPVGTAVLTAIDLLNGMDFRPGQFVRRGHDYRIDSRQCVIDAYGLDCTAEQSISIEKALREREQSWAARRMIARKFAKTRESVARTLQKWGVKKADESFDEFDMLGAGAVPTSVPSPRGSERGSVQSIPNSGTEAS
ncbi:MAG: alpha/beta-hydrolase family protein, partial [Actinomycetes bacterium]